MRKPMMMVRKRSGRRLYACKRRLEKLETKIKVDEEQENYWREILGNEAAGGLLLLKRTREMDLKSAREKEREGDRPIMR